MYTAHKNRPAVRLGPCRSTRFSGLKNFRRALSLSLPASAPPPRTLTYDRCVSVSSFQQKVSFSPILFTYLIHHSTRQ